MISDKEDLKAELEAEKALSRSLLRSSADLKKKQVKAVQ